MKKQGMVLFLGGTTELTTEPLKMETPVLANPEQFRDTGILLSFWQLGKDRKKRQRLRRMLYAKGETHVG